MDFSALRTMRCFVFAVVCFGGLPMPAMAQIQFFDDFERTDNGDLGPWTGLIMPQGGEISYAGVAAKVGSRGLRFVDDQTGAGEGSNISLVRAITPIQSPQSQYIRAWIRLTSVSGAGRTTLLKISHQTFVATEVFLQPNQSLEFFAWQKDASQRDVIGATAVTGIQPLGQWILFELGAVNLGTPNGLAWASIDGQEVMRKSINWTNLYAANVVAGMNYAANDLLATLDYDAFAATTTPPPTRIVTELSVSTAKAGTCVPVQFVLQAAFDKSAQPAFHPALSQVNLSGSASGALFSDAECTTAAGAAPFVAAGQAAATLYVKPLTEGVLTILPFDSDFLAAAASLTVTPSDAPIPDAGQADSGQPNMGGSDSGQNDAGSLDADASIPDALVVDSGAPPSSKSFETAMRSDDLLPPPIFAPRNYDIGCGCSHTTIPLAAVLLLAFRRLFKK
jgi:hypothetical protein